MRRISRVVVGAIASASAGVMGVGGLGTRVACGQILPRDTPAHFVNWENPHVTPVAMTPDGTRLLVVNTADNRLEVFSLSSGALPVLIGSAPVGLDPVSVRARTNTEAWVVNHVSDSVSVVDLTTLNVTATLKTLDEPADVVFAGPGGGRAFVSCSQANAVQVFQVSNLAAAPTAVLIDGEEPRAMAVSADGTKVYVAVFESGNRSTILGGGAVGGMTGMNLAFPPNVVSDPAGPYGGVNPPPNAGNGFHPPIGSGAASPPPVGLIVKKDAAGRWMDDNGRDWSGLVSGNQASLSGRPIGWDLYDHDLAVIDATSLGVQYATGLMNICMALGVNPATGRVTVVGTDALNEVRFEPNVNGRFLKVLMGLVDPANLSSPLVVDLNPHLDYTVSTVPQADRNRSVGDPRGIVWSADGQTGYVTGMGSNNVVVVYDTGERVAGVNRIAVGEGPTGLALDEGRGRLYVLNKFGGSLTVVDTLTKGVVATVALHDSTPPSIKLGRKHLYDTAKNSGLGHVSCASCHVDARIDRLAWDLGDPSGTAGSLAGRNLGANVPILNTGFAPFHAMKGPMTTQTMQDIIGKEPHHWRGDRLGIEEFNGAFISLNGDDENLTPVEMQEFEDFLASIHYPPNPFRNLDNTLPTNVPLTGHFRTGRFGNAGQPLPNGNAAAGLAAYRSTQLLLDAGAVACVTCHTLPTGAGPDVSLVSLFPTRYQTIPAGPMGERHLALVSQDGSSNLSMKIPQLRNMYEKTGFNTFRTRNTAGFGVLHDGSVDSIERFVAEPVFNVTSDQMVADLTAFMLAFSGSELPQGSLTSLFEPPGVPSLDSHAAVGRQTTVGAAADTVLLNQMVALANANRVGLVAKGRVAGRQRGWSYTGSGNWQSDRASEVATTASLLSQAAAAGFGGEITFTVVPTASRTRIGIDRDLDGFYDRDELGVCRDPADPLDRPGTPTSVDADGSLAIDVADIFAFLSSWFEGAADFNGSGSTDVTDIFAFLSAWFAGCP